MKVRVYFDIFLALDNSTGPDDKGSYEFRWWDDSKLIYTNWGDGKIFFSEKFGIFLKNLKKLFSQRFLGEPKADPITVQGDGCVAITALLGHWRVIENFRLNSRDPIAGPRGMYFILCLHFNFVGI